MKRKRFDVGDRIKLNKFENRFGFVVRSMDKNGKVKIKVENEEIEETVEIEEADVVSKKYKPLYVKYTKDGIEMYGYVTTISEEESINDLYTIYNPITEEKSIVEKDEVEIIDKKDYIHYSNNKKSKTDYVRNQRNSDIEKGDTVDVIKKAKDWEDGWQGVWEEEYNKMIGKRGRVIQVDNDNGKGVLVKTELKNAYLPYFVLEKIELADSNSLLIDYNEYVVGEVYYFKNSSNDINEGIFQFDGTVGYRSIFVKADGVLDISNKLFKDIPMICLTNEDAIVVEANEKQKEWFFKCKSENAYIEQKGNKGGKDKGKNK